MPPSKNISFDELSEYFHLPINQVAKELNVCATILKKICRRNGIPRWPHRKIKSLDKMIRNLTMNLMKNPQPSEKDEINKEIESLNAKKKEILKNPTVLVSKTGQDTLKSGISKIKKPQPRLVGPRKDGGGYNFDEDGTINCYAPPSIPNGGDRRSMPVNDSYVRQSELSRPTYVEAVLNGGVHIPYNTPSQIMTISPNIPIQNQNTQNVEANRGPLQMTGINVLANMKHASPQQTPIRKNPSYDLSSYSYDSQYPVNMNHNHNLNLVLNPVSSYSAMAQSSQVPILSTTPSISNASSPVKQAPSHYISYGSAPPMINTSTITSSSPPLISYKPRPGVMPISNSPYSLPAMRLPSDGPFSFGAFDYHHEPAPIPFIPSMDSLATAASVSQSISTVGVANGNSIQSLIHAGPVNMEEAIKPTIGALLWNDDMRPLHM